jgi:HEAT repeat protein
MVGTLAIHLNSHASRAVDERTADPESVSEAEHSRLVSQLDHSDWLVREMSALALADCDDPIVIDALIEALDDEHIRVRCAAARSLGELKAENSVPGLIEQLNKASEKQEIQDIIIALGEIGDPRAVEPIVRAIKHSGRDNDLYPVARAIIGFKDPRIADALLEVMRFDSGDLNYNIVYQLVRVKEEKLYEPLEEALRRGDRSSRSAADALGRLGDVRAVAALIQALRSENPSLRESATKALGELGDKRAVPALVALLQKPDEDEDVMEVACGVLGRLGDRDVTATIEPLTFRSDDRLRAAALDAIADIELGAYRALRRDGAEEAIAIAKQALNGGVVEQRQAAIRALSEIASSQGESGEARSDGAGLSAIGVDEARSLIIGTLDDPHGEVRREAILALVYTDGPWADTGLVTALEDPDEENQWLALRALGRKGNPGALATVLEFSRSKDKDRREYAAEFLRNYRDSTAITTLCALLNDPERSVRRKAAQGLAAVADESALEPLLEAIATDSGEDTRECAARALGRIDDPRSIAALEKALSDDDQRITRAAARSLARLGWNPPDETSRSRYLIASGRADEAGSSAPKAKQVGDEFRLEGPFTLDTPILTPLTVGTDEHPKVVMLHRIEFTLIDQQIHAKLFVNHITWPDSAWLITINLLNESGESVASANHKYRVHGLAIGAFLITETNVIELDLGKVKEPGGIKQFVITVEETIPGHESYEWFRNPANGHFYCLTDPMPWKEARSKSAELGGHLVTVNDGNENEWLRTTFDDCGTLFIGLTDKDEEGTWEWTSGEDSAYRNWNGGEPNDANDYEDVVVMVQGGEWNDISIDTAGRGIVETEKAPERSARERLSGIDR